MGASSITGTYPAAALRYAQSITTSLECELFDPFALERCGNESTHCRRAAIRRPGQQHDRHRRIRYRTTV